VRALDAGDEFPDPVKPDTICKSLAIGNPADGFQVIKVVNETGGAGAMVTDAEILDGIQLLARTEGIFTEPAWRHHGGGDAAAREARRDQGQRVGGDLCHGNGFKTAEVMQGHVQRPVTIGRSLADFERVVAPKVAASQATA
jgi:threonine synthase